MLYGGKDNDTLLGESGDDYLDGGEGEDIAEYSGNVEEYKFTPLAEGVLISDTVAGRDGTDFLRNIEKLNFKNILEFYTPFKSAMFENPEPTDDVLYQDSKGQRFDSAKTYLIKSSTLLKNDVDLQGDNVRIREISSVYGVLL